VGGGPLENKLNNLIQRLDLEEKVQLIGPKPHDEIPIWMNSADIFVLPSIQESFGVVQIEAMTCGKPVIATINGGSEEILNKDSGLLVLPKNSEKLTFIIKAALQKKWDNKKIIEQSKKFTWKTISQNLLDLYKDNL